MALRRVSLLSFFGAAEAFNLAAPLRGVSTFGRAPVVSMSDADFDGVKPSTVFMFPGQGAQVIGMGAEVAKEVPAAAELYKKAADILGYDLLAITDKERLDT